MMIEKSGTIRLRDIPTTTRLTQEEQELADIISEDDTLEKIVDPAYEEVERYLDEESAYKGFQGVALVAQGNEIKFAKAYGNADYDDNIVNKVNTRFAIASNTKQFTAVAIMQLMEDGKINLDDTIDKYFPKFKYANQITVRELLQMRSGLVDYLNAAELYFKDEESLKILNDYRTFSDWQHLSEINNKNPNYIVFEFQITKGLTFGYTKESSKDWFGVEPLNVKDLESFYKNSKLLSMRFEKKAELDLEEEIEK